MRELAGHYDVRFVSKPRWLDQAAAEDKERWLERRLAGVPYKRFLVPRSTDDRGDYLVHGGITEDASRIAREVIHLGSDDFPDWQSVTAYLLARRRDWLQLAGDLRE